MRKKTLLGDFRREEAHSGLSLPDKTGLFV